MSDEFDRSFSEATPRPADCSVLELAVLHQVDGFGERQILDLAEILVVHAGSLQDRARIQLGAGFRRADRQALALQVRQRLDAAVGGGDDLDVVRIDRADDAQLVELGLEAGFGIAFPGGFQRVAEREGDFAAALLQQIEILDRRLGGLHLRLHVGNLLAVDLRDRDPEWIVHAGRAAGQYVDELLGVSLRRRHHQRRGRGDPEQFGLHEHVSPSCLSRETGRSTRCGQPMK